MKESRRLELQAQLDQAVSARCGGHPGVRGLQDCHSPLKLDPRFGIIFAGAQHISQEGLKDGHE